MAIFYLFIYYYYDFFLLEQLEFSVGTARLEEIFRGIRWENTVGHYYEFTRMCSVHCEWNQNLAKSLKDFDKREEKNMLFCTN